GRGGVCGWPGVGRRPGIGGLPGADVLRLRLRRRWDRCLHQCVAPPMYGFIGTPSLVRRFGRTLKTTGLSRAEVPAARKGVAALHERRRTSHTGGRPAPTTLPGDVTPTMLPGDADNPAR